MGFEQKKREKNDIFLIMGGVSRECEFKLNTIPVYHHFANES
tara:strand:- start:109342 stop:109467 length:126 start_codon:yes stop_codon:yes gene_type:complete